MWVSFWGGCGKKQSRISVFELHCMTYHKGWVLWFKFLLHKTLLQNNSGRDFCFYSVTAYKSIINLLFASAVCFQTLYCVWTTASWKLLGCCRVPYKHTDHLQVSVNSISINTFWKLYWAKTWISRPVARHVIVYLYWVCLFFYFDIVLTIKTSLFVRSSLLALSGKVGLWLEVAPLPWPVTVTLGS